MRKFDIVLVGGGHANCGVLADWIGCGRPAGASAALITPQPFLTYSGMVPGWIAGDYASAQGEVDLAALAEHAGAELVIGRCVALDPDDRRVVLDDGAVIGFDFAAIDTGGVGRGQAVLGDDPRLIDVRPMAGFVRRLAAWRAAQPFALRRIAVIGGGAAGLELAFGLRNMDGLDPRPEVRLVAGSEGLLPGFGNRLRQMAARELARQGIACIAADARLAAGSLYAGEQSLEPVHLIVTALGSGAPDWPRLGGLACDRSGFIAVDRYQRSCSHPHILAAGDVAARTDQPVAHSGVHAVYTGPVLAANLRSLAMGKAPRRSYRPRFANLYLMSIGNGEALASFGPLAARGRWVAALKRWIDTRWIAAYAKLSAK
ncbi:MAG: FAD-dependent oxidoreductase [Erythrobacter sp.]